MVVTHSASIQNGTPCPDFSLPCTEGHTHSLESFSEKSWLVVIFMCNHCPFVLPVLDKLIHIQDRFGDQGVQLLGICSNDPETYPDDSFEKMQALATEKGFNFPYLHDESQEVAKAFDATCTPDVFVYDQNRQLVYHGRITDQGMEAEATTNDLEEALEALVHQKAVPFEVQPSMGCNIKWKA